MEDCCAGMKNEAVFTTARTNYSKMRQVIIGEEACTLVTVLDDIHTGPPVGL